MYGRNPGAPLGIAKCGSRPLASRFSRVDPRTIDAAFVCCLAAKAAVVFCGVDDTGKASCNTGSTRKGLSSRLD